MTNFTVKKEKKRLAWEKRDKKESSQQPQNVIRGLPLVSVDVKVHVSKILPAWKACKDGENGFVCQN